jgi:hypothetical protein
MMRWYGFARDLDLDEASGELEGTTFLNRLQLHKN